MFGKIAGAWLGSKAAGRNDGAKGALLGFAVIFALALMRIPLAFAMGGVGIVGNREKRVSVAAAAAQGEKGPRGALKFGRARNLPR